MLVIVEHSEPAGDPRSGPPHAVTVGDDGARVAFLRAGALEVLTVATGTVTQVAAGPLEAYAGSSDLSVLTWAVDGELHSSGAHFEATGRVLGPRPDPAGRNCGYVTPEGTLRVTGPELGDQLLAGEPGSGVTWGVTDPAGAQLGRARGWWWSPDGSRVLAVRSAAGISLHLLDLFGGWVDVHWDRETYPYLAGVRWSSGFPLITVLRRSQQHGLVLSVNPRTGETQVHAELADARWVEPVPGTPLLLPDGRVLVGGELAHDGFDSRCLFADGSLLTPPELYVRRVAGVLAGTQELIVEASEGEPAEIHVYAIRTSMGGGGSRLRRLTDQPGVHHAEVGGDVVLIDDEVHRGTAVVPLPGAREPLPHPVLDRVTDRRLPAAVLYPPAHVAGTRLPVLVEFGRGPGHQQVLLDPGAWSQRRRWAEAGFAVVSVDSRGTPGVAPSFEKAVHRRLADVVLADQVAALHALTGKHPDLDLTRVVARGTGLGGWLAVLAVQRRPDVFRRGIAHDPVLDWSAVPAVLAERYLGSRTDNPDSYDHHAADPPGPALLISPTGGPSEEVEFATREYA